MIQEARKYQAYYTKSTPIVDYMINKLMLSPNDKIFEPCGGDGVFIDAILEGNEYASVDVCELNNKAYTTLKHKFENYSNVNIKQCDTLLDSNLAIYSNYGGFYDKIIANPPYGAWQEFEKRVFLKKTYSGLYAKETYALFLCRCIQLLKNDGILTFIIPDTFLNLHMHTMLREVILKSTKIVDLALFPSSFFPGVNFGYANLSIITLKKCNNAIECLDNKFTIYNSFSKVEQLNDINRPGVKEFSFLQSDIYLNPDHAFLISDNADIAKLINSAKIKIGDIADCVTGFYSGNDKKFLKTGDKGLKNSKNYELVDIHKIHSEYQSLPNLLDGIRDDKYFIPIVKGGNVKYLKPESWYMNWSCEAVTHYKEDKKARFQNPKYYFRFGIGIPMISSSSVTASLIENKLFDQSIVGVFPRDESLTYYLLAFFNSPTCNKLLRTINPSTNNPANYIKKIPFIFPTNDQKELISNIIRDILAEVKKSGSYKLSHEHHLADIIKEIYGF